jgi:hypothetical protein
LPAGEVLLWQGSPDWRVLAKSGFHIRGLALYFATLLGWYALVHFGEPGALLKFASFVGLAVVALGLLAAFAYLVARTTVYTVTSRRVALRFGVALSMTLNLPLALVEAADQRANPDGSGDVSLRLAAGSGISYLLLWPHARPWRLGRAEPMLRSVPNVAALSAALCRAALPVPVPRPREVALAQSAHAA